MSYDISLNEPISGETIKFETAHFVRGGTYAIGGTQEAWLNITYNYAKHYYRVFGEKGIRTIYGMTGAESIPIELADVIIRVLDYCGYAGIDIDAAISQKHEYNKTRPYRHGGKKC